MLGEKHYIPFRLLDERAQRTVSRITNLSARRSFAHTIRNVIRTALQDESDSARLTAGQSQRHHRTQGTSP